MTIVAAAQSRDHHLRFGRIDELAAGGGVVGGKKGVVETGREEFGRIVFLNGFAAGEVDPPGEKVFSIWHRGLFPRKALRRPGWNYAGAPRPLSVHRVSSGFPGPARSRASANRPGHSFFPGEGLEYIPQFPAAFIGQVAGIADLSADDFMVLGRVLEGVVVDAYENVIEPVRHLLGISALIRMGHAVFHRSLATSLSMTTWHRWANSRRTAASVARLGWSKFKSIT